MSFVRARPYTVAAAVLFAALVVPFCRRITADWDAVYVPAAQRLAAGDDVFGHGFVYPPINAWLALPWANLPRVPSRLLWFAVNVAAVAVFACGAWRLSGGGRLDVDAPRSEHLIAGLALLGSGAYILDAITNHQTDLVLAALVVVGCRLLRTRRDISAGALLGLAAGIKCTPLLFAAYLGWKRRWVAAALVPLVAVGVNFVPELTHPRAGEPARMSEWVGRYLAPIAESKHDIGHWHTAINFNHSLAGLTNRLLLWEPVSHGRDMVPAPRADRADARTVKAVALGAMAAFVLATLAASYWQRSGSGEAFEFGLVFILMLMLCPQSSKPHFCTLLLPAFCLARAAVGGGWALRCLMGGVVACGLVVNKDLVGGVAYGWLVWYGAVTAGAALLHAGCCAGMLQSKKAAAAPALPLRRAA